MPDPRPTAREWQEALREGERHKPPPPPRRRPPPNPTQPQLTKRWKRTAQMLLLTVAICAGALYGAVNAQEIRAVAEKAIDWTKEQTGAPQGGPPGEAPPIPAGTPEPISQGAGPEGCPHGYRRSESSGHCERWPVATLPPTPTTEPTPLPTPTPAWAPIPTTAWTLAPTRTPAPGPMMIAVSTPTPSPHQGTTVNPAPTMTPSPGPTSKPTVRATPVPTRRTPPTIPARATPTPTTQWKALTLTPARVSTANALSQYEGPKLAIASLTLWIVGEEGYGSGFFYNLEFDPDKDAYWVVVTNHHVVEGEKNLKVCWAVTQTCRAAEVLYEGSYEFDVAILDYERFNPSEETRDWLWDVALRDWQGWGGEWEKGDVVYASGYPSATTDWSSGYTVPPPVVNDGTVYQDSTVFKNVGDHYAGHYIEHSADVSSGNSGGPLMNSAGWIIGVNAAGSYEPKRIEGAVPMTWVNYWLETGLAPSEWEEDGYGILEFTDGSFYAVLTWTEHGEPGWYYQDDEGKPCVSLVYELSESRYTWASPICYVSGYEDENGTVFVEYGGIWYLAPEIALSEKPEWR